MPARDGTGPRGQGSRTGRGLGPCGDGTNQSGINSQNQTWSQRVVNGLSSMFGRRRGQQGGGRGHGGRGRNR